MRFLVIQDYKENRAKCSLTPLERDPAFTFLRLGHPDRSSVRPRLDGGVLLHVDGSPLRGVDAACLESGPLVLIDCTWARVSVVLRRVEIPEATRLVRRSLPSGFVTAYPRTSKLYEDPEAGLASVEALFVASAVLGQPRFELLRSYRWARPFLVRNIYLLRKLCPDANLSLSRLDLDSPLG
jgi:pre-rRNA-processing protein TSR3